MIISLVQMFVQLAIVFYGYPAQISKSWKEPRGCSTQVYMLFALGHTSTICLFIDSGSYINVIPQVFGLAFVLFNILIVWKHQSVHNIYNNFFRRRPAYN